MTEMTNLTLLHLYNGKRSVSCTWERMVEATNMCYMHVSILLDGLQIMSNLRERLGQIMQRLWNMLRIRFMLEWWQHSNVSYKRFSLMLLKGTCVQRCQINNLQKQMQNGVTSLQRNSLCAYIWIIHTGVYSYEFSRNRESIWVH